MSTTANQPLKIGFIGYGFATRTFHLPFILPHDDLKVVAFNQREGAKSHGQKASNAEDDHPSARRYKDLDAFLADEEVEVVVVATGHDSHAELAERALLAGKHVQVEKPFTCTTEEADRLITTAEKVGKVLSVFQNRRYDSDFMTLRNIVSQGWLGKISDCQINYDIPYPSWALGIPEQEFVPGAGMMYGLGSHIIDQALALFGRPESVTGFYRSVGATKPNRADNAYTIIFQYGGEQSELVVTLKTTVVSLLTKQLKYTVRGDEGSFVKYGEDSQEEQTMSGMDSMDPKFAFEDPSIWGTLTTRTKVLDHQKQVGDLWEGKVESMRGNHHQIYKDVAKAIRGEIKTPVIDPRLARDGIRIIELARQSQDEGRTLKF